VVKLCPLAAFVAALVLAGGASAHDHWLVPARRFVPPGTPVDVHHFFGERLSPEGEHKLDKAKFARITLVAPKWARELRYEGKEGQKPLLTVSAPAGASLVVADRTPHYLTLEPDVFEAYLAEEHQDDAMALRAAKNERRKPGRERYTRFMKTLVVWGDDAAASRQNAYGVEAGQRLEIVLETDPLKAKVGDILTLRVMFEGKPLQRAFAQALVKDDLSSTSYDARTNEEGRASFKIVRSGTWVARLVHVRRCEGCGDADWESFWASYAFPVR
jgi:uncharacterized GH25 family protein